MVSGFPILLRSSSPLLIGTTVSQAPRIKRTSFGSTKGATAFGAQWMLWPVFPMHDNGGITSLAKISGKILFERVAAPEHRQDDNHWMLSSGTGNEIVEDQGAIGSFFRTRTGQLDCLDGVIPIAGLVLF